MVLFFCLRMLIFLKKIIIFAVSNLIIEIMPYRRLPNTDAARVRALKNALNIDSVCSDELKEEIRTFLPKFEMNVANSKMARERQAENSYGVSEYTRKAKLYISHFIQVLNFCIMRGELKPEVREFYGLKISSSRIPSLVSDKSLLDWGEKIIKGEQDRIASRVNGSPIYCPSIALVKVAYEQFKDNYSRHKVFQSSSSRESGKVAELRNEADKLIFELWNAIEGYYLTVEDEEERRSMCEEHGIAYVYKRGEKENIRRRKEAERITLHLFK